MAVPDGESWSIQIYAFGRFEIMLDGELLRFRLKTPRKPLALATADAARARLAPPDALASIQRKTSVRTAMRAWW